MKTHFNSTNTFSYLHGKSNHPPSTFKGVYMGEKYQNSKKHIWVIPIRFYNETYPSHLTSSSSIPFDRRAEYLQTASRETNYPANFITIFDPSISVRDSLLEDWPRISSHPDLRNTFDWQPKLTYKHTRNLAQLLVKAELNENITTDIPTYLPPTV